MRLKRLLTMILMLTSSLIASGCSWLDKEVYVPQDVVLELAEPTRINVWVLDVNTGIRSKRFVRAEAGWLVGRPKGGTPDGE